jgi:energy-coupling factor transporter ATP-binding protein EcfA2
MNFTLSFANHLYRTEPLLPSEHDADFFVGRQTEIQSLVVDLHNERKGLVLVTGHKGVGKTSFVNYVQWLISEKFPSQNSKKNKEEEFKLKIQFNKKIIPCYTKIQLDETDSVKTVLFKALTSLFFSIRSWQENRKESLPSELEKTFAWVSSVVPTSSFSLGASAMGFGMSGSQGVSYRSGSDISSEALCEEIRRLISVVKLKLNMDGVFVCFNNLEIVSEEKSSEILNQLRDYLFEIEGLWTVLIGYPGMYSVLSQGTLRVSEYVSGQETLLAPLSTGDVWKILEKRAEAYFAKELNARIEMPIPQDFVFRVCENSGGEIRAVLKACSDVVKQAMKLNPNLRILTTQTALEILTSTLSSQIGFDALSKKQREIVHVLTETPEGVPPSNYKEFKLKSGVEFRNEMRMLVKRGFVRKTNLRSFEKYEATGQVLLAKYLGISIQ